jgi:hypothetical protein
MALLTTITRVTKTRQKVHLPVEGGVSVFESGGERYIQLDTYGTPERKDAGTISQSLQMDRAAAFEIRTLIDETFGT